MSMVEGNYARLIKFYEKDNMCWIHVFMAEEGSNILKDMWKFDLWLQKDMRNKIDAGELARKIMEKLGYKCSKFERVSIWNPRKKRYEYHYEAICTKEQR